MQICLYVYDTSTLYFAVQSKHNAYTRSSASSLLRGRSLSRALTTCLLSQREERRCWGLREAGLVVCCCDNCAYCHLPYNNKDGIAIHYGTESCSRWRLTNFEKIACPKFWKKINGVFFLTASSIACLADTRSSFKCCGNCKRHALTVWKRSYIEQNGIALIFTFCKMTEPVFPLYPEVRGYTHL